MDQGYASLGNSGVTCYINAVVQMMATAFTYARPAPALKGMAGLLHEVGIARHGRKVTVVGAARTVDAFNSCAAPSQRYQNRVMGDANEAYGVIVAALEKTNPDVAKTFCGTRIAGVTCGTCGTVSTRKDNFYCLDLPIGVPFSQHLLNMYEEEVLEKDTAYVCEKCNEKVPRAVRAVNLECIPQHIVVNITRFRRSTKVFRSHQFEPVIRLEVDGDAVATLTLVAVVVHHGGFNHGHYVCYTQTPSGRWLRHNDAKTHVMPTSPLGDGGVQKNAYQLMYRACGVA